MSDKHPSTPQYEQNPRSDHTKNQLSASNPLGVPPANLLSAHFSDYIRATEGSGDTITNRRPHHLRESHQPHYHSEEQDIPVTVPGKGVFSSSSEAALALGIAKSTSDISLPSAGPTPLHHTLQRKETQKRGEAGTYLHSEKYAAPPSASSSIADQSLTDENRSEGTKKFGGPSGAALIGGTGGGSWVALGQSSETQQPSHTDTDGGIGGLDDPRKIEKNGMLNKELNSGSNNNELFSVLFPDLFDTDKYMESVKNDAPRHNGILHYKQFIEKAKTSIQSESLCRWTQGEEGDRLKSFVSNEIMMALDGVLVQEPVLLGGFIQLIRIQKIADLMNQAIEKKEKNYPLIHKGAELLQAELFLLNLLSITPIIRLINDWEHRAKAHNMMMEHVKQTVDLLNKILRSN